MPKLLFCHTQGDHNLYKSCWELLHLRPDGLHGKAKICCVGRHEYPSQKFARSKREQIWFETCKCGLLWVQVWNQGLIHHRGVTGKTAIRLQECWQGSLLTDVILRCEAVPIVKAQDNSYFRLFLQHFTRMARSRKDILLLRVLGHPLVWSHLGVELHLALTV